MVIDCKGWDKIRGCRDRRKWLDRGDIVKVIVILIRLFVKVRKFYILDCEV